LISHSADRFPVRTAMDITCLLPYLPAKRVKIRINETKEIKLLDLNAKNYIQEYFELMFKSSTSKSENEYLINEPFIYNVKENLWTCSQEAYKYWEEILKEFEEIKILSKEYEEKFGNKASDTFYEVVIHTPQKNVKEQEEERELTGKQKAKQGYFDENPEQKKKLIEDYLSGSITAEEYNTRRFQ
jgi:hypothetical protein